MYSSICDLGHIPYTVGGEGELLSLVESAAVEAAVVVVGTAMGAAASCVVVSSAAVVGGAVVVAVFVVMVVGGGGVAATGRDKGGQCLESINASREHFSKQAISETSIEGRYLCSPFSLIRHFQLCTVEQHSWSAHLQIYFGHKLLTADCFDVAL